MRKGDVRLLLVVFSVIGALVCTQVAEVGAISIDFESLGDSESVTNQFSGLGVTFTNATVLTAGISLNEIEFPPHSGDNVVFDDGGAMTGIFSQPVIEVGGSFTYGVPITLTAFDALNNQVGSVTSSFTENFVSSGNPPNEFLQVVFASGIARVTITGDNLGGSFVMDDFTFTPAQQPIPEPSTYLLMLTGLGVILAIKHYTKQPRRSR